MELAAIVLDVDGTLLTSQHRISDASHAAIAATRSAGIRVILASARGPAELWPIVKELDLSGPLVTFGGALVLEARRPWRASSVRFERRIRHSSASRVVAEALRLGLEVGWHADEQWYAPVIGEGLQREAEITGLRLEPLVDDGACAAPHKLLCIADPLHGLAALRTLRARLPRDCQAHHSHRHYLEITARGVDKASAVRSICTRLSLPLEALAAIGDGENDIALLRLAGVGVAMGHSDATVRAAADWVTATNDEDGVACAIEALLSAGDRPCAEWQAVDPAIPCC